MLAVLFVTAALGAQADSVLDRTPEAADAFGINIHFVDPAPGEMAMLAATGVRWIRMDFSWAATERVGGEYDFSAYDQLMAALDSNHLHPIFILDYSNPQYDQGLSPASDEGRQAFAHWAAAAATHFGGRGVQWEMYNEPDWRFWTPRPSTDDYIRLALATGEALKESAPGEKLIGPASAVIDPPFLEACFRAGLLNYWSAVSIHPYRSASSPETVADDLRQVRLLIRNYAPPGKTIPIIVSEWGYSALWTGMNERKQAQMVVREWLTDLANDVPLTIWYDWRDGADPHDPEVHFGLIGSPAPPGATASPDAFLPKPAYLAAKALTQFLAGFHFNKRLALVRADDYLLLFAKGEDVRLVAWTTGPPHAATLPASPGVFLDTGLTGEKLAPLEAGRHGLDVTLTGEPQYLVPQQPNELLAIAATWRSLPLEIMVRAPAVLPLHLQVKNPLAKSIRFDVQAENAPWEAGPPAKAEPGEEADLSLRVGAVTRSVDPLPLRVEIAAGKLGNVAQTTWIVPSNPLRVTVLPATAAFLPVSILNPSGDAFRGSIRAVEPRGLKLASGRERLNLKQGDKEATVRLPLEESPEAEYGFGVAVLDEDQDVVSTTLTSRFRRLADFLGDPVGSVPAGYHLIAEGGADSAVSALAIGLPPEGPPQTGMAALQIAFRLPAAGSSLRIVSTDPKLAQIEGEPRALGLWLRGDASGTLPYLRFTDSTGQTFQEGGGPINWHGWRYVLILMDTPRGTHSGGANDGVIHYPIRWDSLFMIENASREESQGRVYLSGVTLVYGGQQKMSER
ncbi:MAG TPA: hypothetical protein VI455_19685 [Terriglobia bacterium]